MPHKHSPLPPGPNLLDPNEFARHHGVHPLRPFRVRRRRGVSLDEHLGGVMRLLDGLVTLWVEPRVGHNDHREHLHETYKIYHFLPRNVTRCVAELLEYLFQVVGDHPEVPQAKLLHVGNRQPLPLVRVALRVPAQQLDEGLLHNVVPLALLHKVVVRAVLRHQEAEVYELVEVGRVCLVLVDQLELELEARHDVEAHVGVHQGDPHGQLDIVDVAVARLVKLLEVLL
mmetsp:Transcript_32075/g.80727  ORF Transcript_32075/g.80727 Transcript_32075/m.80727 type:complete len:228 (-) Transcript_32075:735-1418(-)